MKYGAHCDLFTRRWSDEDVRFLDVAAEGLHLLAEIGFDGYVGLETYNSSMDDFAFERGMFHNVCPDGRTFLREGVAFLRSREACFKRPRPGS